MSERVNLWKVSELADERIVGWNGPVVFDAKNFPNVRKRILRQFPDVAIAAGNEEKSSLVECDPRTITIAVGRAFSAATSRGTSACTEMRFGNENILTFSDCRATVPFRAIHGEC